MSKALEIAEQLNRLGTDVFVVYSPEENEFPTPKIKYYKSEAKYYVSDLDNFIGAEVELQVNIDEPLPLIEEEEPQKEPSEAQLKETPKESCTKICLKTPAGKASNKSKSGTKNVRFPCSYKTCDRNYSSRSNLLQHIRDWHFKTKNHACKLCSKRFARKSSLRVHERVHIGLKLYGCNICEQRFRDQINLVAHREEFHSKGDNRCRSCNEQLPNENELRFHELAHEGNHCFVCRTCNMRFILSFDLDQHKCPFADIDIYAGCNKPTTLPSQKKQVSRVCCKICNKKVSKRYIITHEAIVHRKAKLYDCFVCGEAFRTVYSLNKHKRIVHDIRKRKICDSCQDDLALKTGPNGHEKIDHKKDIEA